MELTTKQRNKRCEILLDQGRYQQAEAEARLALTSDGEKRADALVNLSRALFGQGKLDDAESAACKSIAEDPDLPHGYYVRGAILRVKGDLKGAEAAVREAIRRCPDYATYHRELATILLDGDRVDQALESIHLGLKHDPESVTLWQKRVRAMLQLGRLLDAKAAGTHALSLDPLNDTTLLQLGRIEGTLGNLGASEKYLREALRLDPKSQQVKDELLGILYSRPILSRWLVQEPEQQDISYRRWVATVIIAGVMVSLGGWKQLWYLPVVRFFWVIFLEHMARYLYFPCCTLWLYCKGKDRPLFTRFGIAGAVLSSILVLGGLILLFAAPYFDRPSLATYAGVAFLAVIPFTLFFQFNFPVYGNMLKIWLDLRRMDANLARRHLKVVKKFSRLPLTMAGLVLLDALPVWAVIADHTVVAFLALIFCWAFSFRLGRPGIALPKWKTKAIGQF